MRNKQRGMAALTLAALVLSLFWGGCGAAGGAKEAGCAPARPPVETSRISVMVGSTNEQYADTHFPDADVQRFNNYVDSTAALAAGKVDYSMMDYISALRFVRYNGELEIASGFLTDEKMCLGVGKSNPELFEKVAGELDRLLADGIVADMLDRWIKPDGSDYEPKEAPVWDDAPVIRVAIVSSREPQAFVMSGEYAGLDIELIGALLYNLGYRAEYLDMEFSAVPAAIESGRADMTLGMYNTPERAEKILFTNPFFSNPQVLLARKQRADMSGAYSGAGVSSAAQKAMETSAGVAKESFFAALMASFTRTFLTESRWKLVLSGLGVTVLLSVCSGILGSVVGFGVCMLRRSRNRMASAPAAVFIRIIQGTPIVVLLMILYYIIFGKVDLPAILVAILGFSLNFGAYVSEMMRTGIEAVDKGQIEAAHALGFTKTRTFWKITFLQAARHFLPVYKGEFISMVKMTSVVGYIAIQDLTKVSDIIRSRTLEAFFPLIATAVIYFLVANAVTLLLSRVEFRLDPKRRRRAVKGVVAR